MGAVASEHINQTEECAGTGEISVGDPVPNDKGLPRMSGVAMGTTGAPPYLLFVHLTVKFQQMFALPRNFCCGRGVSAHALPSAFNYCGPEIGKFYSGNKATTEGKYHNS